MERFTLKVASKRQVTIPGRLLELLHIGEGDVIELVVERGSFTGRGLKLVPSSLFTDEVLEELKQRENSLDLKQGVDIKDSRQLAAKILKS
jgi:bifunctional DNA-binding transcriptional regulator/antitoxin component of YhaV-PrlF toxin-antitoxin module